MLRGTSLSAFVRYDRFRNSRPMDDSFTMHTAWIMDIMLEGEGLISAGFSFGVRASWKIRIPTQKYQFALCIHYTFYIMYIQFVCLHPVCIMYICF